MATAPSSTPTTATRRRRTREVSARARVINAVIDELARQDAKWGQQDDPNVSLPLLNHHAVPLVYRIPSAGEARERCERRFGQGTGAWADILVEEVAETVEAAAAGNHELLRGELVQVAAVALQWAAAIDRQPTRTEQAVPDRGLDR